MPAKDLADSLLDRVELHGTDDAAGSLRDAAEEAPLPVGAECVVDDLVAGAEGGVAIEQARQSLALALQALRPHDSFNLIEFNSTHRMLFKMAVPASSHNVQRALATVGRLEAGGGTEMLPALRAALAKGPETAMEPDG